MTDQIDAWMNQHRGIVRTLLWLLTAILLLFALRQLAPVVTWLLGILSPFLIGLVLAYVLHPVVSFVQQKLKLGRSGGILFVAFSIVAIVVGFLSLLVPVLYQQAKLLINSIRENIPAFIDRLAAHFDPSTRDTIETQLRNALASIDQWAQDAVTQLGGSIKPVAAGGLQAVSNVAEALISIGGLIATAVLVVIITFYYLADMDKIPAIIRRLLPARHRERIWSIMIDADRAVGGFLRGQLTVCVIMAVLISIILMVIGMRQYAILIGCFAGAMNFIPYLGPVMGATPAVLWAIFNSQMEGWNERGIALLIIAGGFAMVQAIEGFILQPFVVGKQASLHPLTVILALAVGAQAGIGGMIVAVPVACIVKVVWLELFWKKRPAPPEAAAPAE